MTSNSNNTAIEYITQADIDKVANNHTIPYGTFGEIVDIRTYRRWLPQQKRRETAYERWMRIINYNLNLVSDKHDYDYLRKEALLMLDKFSNMQADLSGRTKWVGGTSASDKDPSSQFNCSFTVINRIEAFLDAFMLLMNGCGVGYRVFSEDIAQLPNITNSNLKVTFETYEPLPKEAREEFSYLQVIDNVAYVEVGDSKEGWVSALRTYLYIVTGQSYFELNIAKKEIEIDLRSIHTITYNFNSVRPIGERINGFGGTASGYLALQEIITDIHRIFSELPGNWLRSVDCNDIVCAIAKGVVAGSSRRSALICLFDQDDTLMSSSKVGLYTNPELAHKGYRSQVNITACLFQKPSLDKIKSLLATCKTEGEPGFNNYSEMVKRRENAAQKYRPGNPVEWYTNVGTNPCFAAGTMVMTREGHYPIEDLVGKVVEVHDGNDWVEIDNFRVTAEDQEVYKVTLSNGLYVRATAYHTFILADGSKKELRHLLRGDYLLHGSFYKESYTENERLPYYKNVFVVSIEPDGVEDKVYCCTVPTNNTFCLSVGIQVGQCHEILLSAGKSGNSVSFCNLTTLPLPNFINANGRVSYDQLADSIRLNVRSSLRQTCVDFISSEWTETQSDERLLGVSLTGCQDFFSLLGWKTGSSEINNFLSWANAIANHEADIYSKALGVPRPLLVTALKPEGTSSSVFGVSSGLHWDWSPYYIRRVRMTAKDALAQTLLTQGFTAKPELYDLERLYPDTSLTGWDRLELFDKLAISDKIDILNGCNTVVFEFPVKSYSNRTQSEVSAIEQLESLKSFAANYTDHMPSCTISVKYNEWDEVAEWINDNWDDYLTASFFSYYGSKYPLLPYEAISEEEYHRLVSLIPEYSKFVLSNGRITYKVDEDLLNQFEAKLDTSTDDEELGSDCSSGACPIR